MGPDDSKSLIDATYQHIRTVELINQRRAAAKRCRQQLKREYACLTPAERKQLREALPLPERGILAGEHKEESVPSDKPSVIEKRMSRLNCLRHL